MSENQSDLAPSDLPSYPDQVLYAGEATLGKEKRKSITKKLQVTQKENISQAVCALLNSGGGIVSVRSADKDYNYKNHGLPHDIETVLCKLFPYPSGDYFDIIQRESFLLIFVKTWSTQNGFPMLRCLDTGLYVRSLTMKIESDAMLVLNRATGNMKRARRSSIVFWQQYIIKSWLDKPYLTAGEYLGLSESDHVEFKDFSTEKLLERMKEVIELYFSAFGNSDGGYLIIGVDDNGRVTGCRKDFEKAELEKCIKESIDKVKIIHLDDHNTSNCNCSNGHSRDCGSHNEFYNLTIKEVKDTNQEHVGYVIFLEVKPVCCLVFAEDPQCWILDPDHNKEERLCACKWVKMMTNKPSESLESKFECLNIGGRPPLAKTVCMKKGLENLSELQKNIFGSFQSGVTIKPELLHSELQEEYPELDDLLQTVLSNEDKGVVILSRSWAVDLEEKSNPNVVCDALLLISGKHPMLCSVVIGERSDTDYKYSFNTARTLKMKLVHLGGYTRKLCIIPNVLQLNSGNMDPRPDIEYPETYKLHDPEAVKELLPYLLIVMLSFRSYLSDKIGLEYFNLLTSQQYKILSQNLFKGTFFVQGPPGTGKTILALKIIQKIQNTFNCSPENILFICENQPLRQYVQYQKICHAVTRRRFEQDDFLNVKHIVVDEAQNFQVEEFNWFIKAEQIMDKVKEKGIFYIFFDQFKSCHTRTTGLPPLRRHVETLTKVVRSPQKICKFMFQTMEKIASRRKSPLMKKILESSECSHVIPGLCEVHEECDQSTIVKKVAETCGEYLSTGYRQGDIAILCSTSEAVEHYRPLLEKEIEEETKKNKKLSDGVRPFVEAEDITKDNIVLDSIRRFSGLERLIVFAINPVCADHRVDDNMRLCAASRATGSLHLYY